MEKQVKSTARMALDNKASVALNQMFREIKDGTVPVKVTPSQLASWIIAHFHQSSFEASKEAIRREFLDRRQWVHQSLKNADNAEIEQVLRDVLKGMEGKKRKRPKTV